MVPDKVLNSLVRYILKEIRRVDPAILADLKRDLGKFNASRGKWDAPRKRRKAAPTESDLPHEDFWAGEVLDGLPATVTPTEENTK